MELYIFCSDDRKVRSVMSNQSNIDCVRALTSFYLAKNYLHMSKEYANSFLIRGWLCIEIKNVFKYIAKVDIS